MERSPRTSDRTSTSSILARVRNHAKEEGWSVTDVTPTQKGPQGVPVDPSIGLSDPSLRLNFIARTPATEEFFRGNDPQPITLEKGKIVVVLSRPAAYLFRRVGDDLKYLAIPSVDALTEAVFQRFIRDE